MRLRAGHERPAAVSGRGWAFALALVLAAPVVGSRAPAADPPAPRTPTIYHKSRNFRIPFNVDPSDRPRLREVQLYVSEDSGYHWEMKSRTTPDRPVFSFRAAHDGEYWFAVRTVDTKGRLFPGDEEQAEPSMKVIVDTNPPALVVEPDGRRGSLAAVRWDMKDENLDPRSLVLEYQVEGARDWRTLPIRRYGLIGSESWDAGTAEPLKLRASVADKAGNVTDAVISLPEGTAPLPGSAANDTPSFANPPPISQISSGPTIPPRDDFPRAGRAGPSPAQDPFPFPTEPAPLQGGAPPRPQAGAGAIAGAGDPFGEADQAFPGGNPSGLTPPSAAAAAGVAPPPAQLVSSPKFPLQYAVEDAGPNGPARVELWVTMDGGRTWFQKGEDPDRTSPFDVDLGSQGTFGLRLVARSASGLGDVPPAPGDPPHLVVKVDSIAPNVQLMPPVVGTLPKDVGKVAVVWDASDPHIGPRAVTISWRPDQPGSAWQKVAEGLENTGRYVWLVPTGVPPRFHLRVEVVDEAGNVGGAETPEASPVLLDRTRPHSRIIGLDPSARTGMRPVASPFR